MQELDEGHSPILQTGECALVVDADGDARLYTREYDDDSEVPRMHRLLTACLVKAHDDSWVDNMLANLDSAH